LQPAEQVKLKQAMQQEYKKAQALGIGSSVLGNRTAREFAVKAPAKAPAKALAKAPAKAPVATTDTKPAWMDKKK